MIGYHGDAGLKARFSAHVERHRLDDQIMRGTFGDMVDGQWRGCAVGCSLRSLDEIDGTTLQVWNGDHKRLADRLGVPLPLTLLEDRIFEGLPLADAKLWPTLFAQAIPVGGDLSLVWPRFAHWMLVDPTAGVVRFSKKDRTKDAIQAVATLFLRQINGEEVSLGEWRATRSAAAYAAATAAAAAAAAYAAADAADAAAAAYAAAAAAAAAAADDAAAAAAAAAAATAGSRHFKTMAEALLRFMSEAPVKP